MDKIEQYRNYIQEIIQEYGQYKYSYGDIEAQMIFDTENEHYQLLNVGWHGNRRIRVCILHIDIKNNKIWIQHNGREIGVPKEDIVLAFHAPYKRPYTGFAVN